MISGVIVLWVWITRGWYKQDLPYPEFLADFIHFIAIRYDLTTDQRFDFSVDVMFTSSLIISSIIATVIHFIIKRYWSRLN